MSNPKLTKNQEDVVRVILQQGIAYERKRILDILSKQGETIKVSELEKLIGDE